MTSKDKEVLSFMKTFVAIHGRPPKLDQIQHNIIGLNHRSSVFYSMQRLLAQGELELVAPTNHSRRYKPREQ